MTDAQTWTLIIGFLTAIAALIAVLTQMTIRVMHAEIGGLRSDLTTQIRDLGGRIDRLDRDVQAVVNRLIEG